MDRIAELREIAPHELESITTRNATEFFGLPVVAPDRLRADQAGSD
jgi:hypothetical protein